MKFVSNINVPDEIYGSNWNGSVNVPTKNAIYDKIESLSFGISVGQAVSGGGVNRLLYEDGSQNLVTSTNLIYSSSNLLINGSTSTNGLQFGASDASNGFWIRNDGVNAVISTKLQNLYIGYGGASGLVQHFYAGNTPSEVLTLQNNLVLIGSGVILRSTQTSGGSLTDFTNGADANLQISVSAAGAGDKYSSFLSTTNTRVAFGANNSEIAAVYPGGYFGIGTGSSIPTHNLEVIGTGSFTGALTIPINAYSSSWNGSTKAATEDAVYDKIESLNVVSGTYTPTLTNTTNISASTARLCTYIRVGNVVTVSGQFDIDPITVASATLLRMSLPIASVFTTVYQAGGTANAINIAGMSAGIEADPTNDCVSVRFISSDVSNQTMAFTFTYQII